MTKIFFSLIFLFILSPPDNTTNWDARNNYLKDTLFETKDDIRTDYAPRGLVFEVIELREEVHNLKDRIGKLEYEFENFKLRNPEWQDKNMGRIEKQNHKQSGGKK